MDIEWSSNVGTSSSTHIISAAAVESNAAAAALQKFMHALRDVEIAKYTLVATFMLFVYDLLLTFNEEIYLVWPSRFGVSKALFFLNRYFPFVDLIMLVYVLMAGSDPVLCVRMFLTLGGFVAFGFVTAQLILAMRTWAIWGRRKSVTLLLVTILISASGVYIYVLYRYFSGISYAPLGPFEPAFQGCPLHFENRFVYVEFVIVIIMESITLTLLVVKAFEHFKQSQSTLMVQMFKDGVIYFVFILISSIANLVVITSTPLELHNFLIITQRIIHSVFCSRILLHIRGAYTTLTFGSTTPDNSQHIQRGGQYAMHRPISGPDALYNDPRFERVGGGRLGRQDSVEVELTSVDEQIQQHGSVQSKSDNLDGPPILKGWGMVNGFDGRRCLDVGVEGWIERGRQGDREMDRP